MEKYCHITDKSLRILFLDEKTKETEGYIYLDCNSNHIWEVKTIVSHKGHSILLHTEAMKFVYPDSIIPYRGEHINLKLRNTYYHFINNDLGIESFKFHKISKEYIDLPGHNDWYNRIYKFKSKPFFGDDFNYIQMGYNEIHTIGLNYFLSKYNK